MADAKRVEWVGSSLDDLREFPDQPRHDVGVALRAAQLGYKHPDAKPLKGFGGASVLEIVENFDSDTYRAVYTVRFEEAVYVLHCFQKKSTSGIKTPKRELDMIESRLKQAQRRHQEWQKEQRKRE